MNPTPKAVLCLGILTVVLIIGSSEFRPKAQASSTLGPVQRDQIVGDHVMKLIQIVQPDLSVARRQILARTFVRVTGDVLENEEQARYFAILVAIESRFNPTATSTAGAVGMAQIMPAYAKEFGKLCGVSDFTNADLVDPELNLTIGACIFRALLGVYKGNLAAVLVAYNAGSASLSMKQLQSLGNITNDETPRYVTRFMYLEQMTKKL